jgi:ABC-2 type transport system permease protein
MYFGRTAAIVLRQYYLMRGSVARIMPLFAWVAIDIVLWGFITRYLNSVTTGVNFVPALLGAVLLWDFFQRVMQGVSMGFLEDVWSRNFLNFFATPLRITEYLLPSALSRSRWCCDSVPPRSGSSGRSPHSSRPLPACFIR